MPMETGNLITVVFGLGLVAAGVYAYHAMGRFNENAREAVGVVVEVVREAGSQQSRIRPALKFKTDEGKEVVGRSRQHYNTEIGATLPLLYNPKDPEHVEVGTLASARNWQLGVGALCVLFGLGICFIGVGLELGILNWRSDAYRRG
jgi:hypothetical protein